MDWLGVAALLVAGAAMGFVNNLAGAGGLIGLFAFDVLARMSTAAANASLRPAAIAIALAGMVAFARGGHPTTRRVWLLGLAAVPGALVGTWLAIALPVWVYRIALVVVIAAVLAQQLRPAGPPDRRPKPQPSPWRAGILFTLVGAHMGFLQVGVGLLTMAALTQVHSLDLVAVNAAKMAVVALTSVVSTAGFAAAAEIDWAPALWLALGAGLGSWVGTGFSIRKGHAAVRAVVLLVCAAVLVRLGFQVFG
jgi:hypothetical protein